MTSHENARTTVHQRKRIRHSRATDLVQALALGVSVATVSKWRRRADPQYPLHLPPTPAQSLATLNLTLFRRFVPEGAGGPDLSAVRSLCGGGTSPFGLRASSVSRRFIRASARHLQTFCDRRLDRDEFVAVVFDGKTFAQDAMVIALGITLQG